MADPITSKQLLAEVENLCQSQIRRLQDEAAQTSIEIQTASATHVSHAVGKRKPNLTELESQPLRRSPRSPKLNW